MVNTQFLKDYTKTVNVINNPNNTITNKKAVMNYVELFRAKWLNKINASEACFECLDSLLKQFSHKVDIIT
jgi:hypothetical protein